MDTTTIIRTLALLTVITGLAGLLAACLSGRVPGITDTMDRAVTTVVRVMVTAIGLDMDITRPLPTDLWVADIRQGVFTVALAPASMAAEVSTEAAATGNLF